VYASVCLLLYCYVFGESICELPNICVINFICKLVTLTIVFRGPCLLGNSLSTTQIHCNKIWNVGSRSTAHGAVNQITGGRDVTARILSNSACRRTTDSAPSQLLSGRSHSIRRLHLHAQVKVKVRVNFCTAYTLMKQSSSNMLS